MKLNKFALGKKIKAVRDRKGISQQTLAELIDRTPTHISYCESGRRNISLDSFVRIANALNVSADELLVDSLVNTLKVSNHEFAELLTDCNEYEMRVILDVLVAAKASLRANIQNMIKRQERL